MFCGGTCPCLSPQLEYEQKRVRVRSVSTELSKGKWKISH